MALDLNAPTPLAYFAALVQGDGPVPLLEAAAALAQDDAPDLDLQQVLGDVDRLGARLARSVPPSADPMARLHALNRFFFGELGFVANLNDYYKPENSYLHMVLRTRRGIPISLAVIWLELAQTLELAAEGIGFPGHFLVQLRLPDGRVVIDPCTGQSLSREDLLERVEQLQPPGVAGTDAGRAIAPYLVPAAPRAMLVRMLRNLQDIHRNHADWRRFVAVQDRLLILLPTAWSEVRDRGLALAALGERERARADLSAYLREARDAADHRAIAARLAALGGQVA